MIRVDQGGVVGGETSGHRGCIVQAGYGRCRVLRQEVYTFQGFTDAVLASHGGVFVFVF